MMESEAKTKWCPMVRVGLPDQFGNGTVSNRVESDQPETVISYSLCIGSACMMWRWQEKFELLEAGDAGSPHLKWVVPTDGHCGLAGAVTNDIEPRHLRNR